MLKCAEEGECTCWRKDTEDGAASQEENHKGAEQEDMQRFAVAEEDTR